MIGAASSLLEVICQSFGVPFDSVLWFSDSFPHCQVWKVKSNGHILFFKSIDPARLSQEPDQQKTAEWIARLMTRFSDQLCEVGIKVPPQHRISVLQFEQGPRVIEMAEYCGQDVAAYFKTAPLEAVRSYVTRIISESRKVLSLDGLGIDPILTNWAVGQQEDDLIYIDFWPAMVVDRGIKQVCYPQPVNQQLIECAADHYYSLSGILRTLRFNLTRTNPDWEDLFFSCAQYVLGADTVQKIFEPLPEQAAWIAYEERDVDSLLAIIDGLKDDQMDDMREISLLLLKHQPEKLDALFRLGKGLLLLSDAERRERITQFRRELRKIAWSNLSEN